MVNTGWLGYARVDYKEGSQIEGWGASAGLRYQFTPEMIASVMPVKAKAPARPYIAPTSWTGFYVGGILGADYGRSDVTVLTAVPQKERPWVATTRSSPATARSWSGDCGKFSCRLCQCVPSSKETNAPVSVAA